MLQHAAAAGFADHDTFGEVDPWHRVDARRETKVLLEEPRFHVQLGDGCFADESRGPDDMYRAEACIGT